MILLQKELGSEESHANRVPGDLEKGILYACRHDLPWSSNITPPYKHISNMYIFAVSWCVVVLLLAACSSVAPWYLFYAFFAAGRTDQACCGVEV